MDDEYILIFDYAKQYKQATSVDQAIKLVFDYLDNTIQDYLDSDIAPDNEEVQIDIMHEGGELAFCSPSKGKELLQNNGGLELFINTKSSGIWGMAAVVATKLKGKYKHLWCQQPHSKEQKERIQRNNEIVKLADHSQSLFELPNDITSIQIVQETENRLFACHLYQALLECHKSTEDIEKECDFIPGTIHSLLSLVNPKRPPQSVVDKIARAIKVKPQQLWINLVSYYIDMKPDLVERIQKPNNTLT